MIKFNINQSRPELTYIEMGACEISHNFILHDTSIRYNHKNFKLLARIGRHSYSGHKVGKIEFNTENYNMYIYGHIKFYDQIASIGRIKSEKKKKEKILDLANSIIKEEFINNTDAFFSFYNRLIELYANDGYTRGKDEVKRNFRHLLSIP